MNIDPKSGLPSDIDVFEEIAKGEQRIHIQTEKKKFGKVITMISGFQGVDLKAIARGLKQELACGGTVKNEVVELQGDHTKNAKKALIKLGFAEDTIESA